MFNNLGRIGSDKADESQRAIQNTRFANATVGNYFSNSSSSSLNDTVKFATKQPTMMVSGTALGKGLSGNVVDYESLLFMKQDSQRPLERLMLHPRPFVTVPYLGKGAFVPDVESGLQRGNMIWQSKSEKQRDDKSFMEYQLSPDYESNNIPDVEEHVLDGWVRGGNPSRINH